MKPHQQQWLNEAARAIKNMRDAREMNLIIKEKLHIMGGIILSTETQRAKGTRVRLITGHFFDPATCKNVWHMPHDTAVMLTSKGNWIYQGNELGNVYYHTIEPKDVIGLFWNNGMETPPELDIALLNLEL
jgi:hypothetical protein